ncbi:DUF6660 family protein [Pedobacter sp. PWIIR3]
MLTVLPCQDELYISRKSAQISSITKPLKGNQQHGQELCPPFCSCACCSVSRDFIAHAEQCIVISYMESTFSKYRVPAISDTFMEIYQPPRLV